MDRRDAIKAGAAMVAGYGIPAPAYDRFRRELAQGQYTFRFFTAAEQPGFRLLADMIIPRDERSGSASDAGTVEYADFVLGESSEQVRTQWHDGLRWLDEECTRRWQNGFTACTEEQRVELLTAIAFPATATEVLRTQSAWFTRARDLVGSGFFSSQVGVEDIRYLGGVFTAGWQGAPPEALQELGVDYTTWDRLYGGRRR